MAFCFVFLQSFAYWHPGICETNFFCDLCETNFMLLLCTINLEDAFVLGVSISIVVRNPDLLEATGL
jgi:hypothetical protein